MYLVSVALVGFLTFLLLFSGIAFHIKGTPVIILKTECLLESLVSIFYLIVGELNRVIILIYNLSVKFLRDAVHTCKIYQAIALYLVQFKVLPERFGFVQILLSKLTDNIFTRVS